MADGCYIIDVEVWWNDKLKRTNPAWPQGPQYYEYNSIEEAYAFLENFVEKNTRSNPKYGGHDYIVRDKAGRIKSTTHIYGNTSDGLRSVTCKYEVRFCWGRKRRA